MSYGDPGAGTLHRDGNCQRNWYRKDELLHVPIRGEDSRLPRERKNKRIDGLVLEVKGDFCHKVQEILNRHSRAEDYVEIGLGSEYRYNPLHNDLDAYALAYNIASLLNNLFASGKEPFWQQAGRP